MVVVVAPPIPAPALRDPERRPLRADRSRPPRRAGASSRGAGSALGRRARPGCRPWGRRSAEVNLSR